MNVMFTPAANVLGRLPGGWLSVILTLIVAFIVTRMLGKGLLSRGQSRLLLAILASLVLYTGFAWTAEGWMGLVRVLCILAIISTTIVLVVDRLRGTSDGLWKVGSGAGKFALVASIVLASNLGFGGNALSVQAGVIDFSLSSAGLQSADSALRDTLQGQSDEAIEKAKTELREEFTSQLEAAKIDATSFETECRSVPNICARIIKNEEQIDQHEERLDGHDEDISEIQKDLKMLHEKSKNVVALPENIESVTAAESLANSLAPMGWKKGEVVTGSKIDYTKNRYDAGRQAFVEQTINTPAKYAAHLNGTSVSDKDAKALVLDNTPEGLHDDILKGESVIPVQFTEDSCVKGNTGHDGDKVVRFDRLCHEAGDIWWVPVGPDGTVYWAAAVRADCGNPGVYVAPYPRDMPAPSVCPPGSDRAGMTIGEGCYNQTVERRTTPPGTSAPPNNPAPSETPTPPNNPSPPATTPPPAPPTTAPPTTEEPEKVPVCINDGGDIGYVPPSEAHKYPKPNADGTCAKNEDDDPAASSSAGNGGGENEDPGPGPTTNPTQPPSTPRPTPVQPTAEPTTDDPTSSQSPPPPAETSAPDPTDPAEGCSPAPGRTCP